MASARAYPSGNSPAQSGFRITQLPFFPLLILVTVVFVAVLAPVLTGRDPYDPSLSNKLFPPDWGAGNPAFPLGTDSLGRDVLTRLFYGARITMGVTLVALLIGAAIGLAVGIAAGYLGGRVDGVLSRAIDSTLAFPTILIALVMAVTLGPSLGTVVTAISLVLWARFARIIRGQVLAVKGMDFIAQATVVGCSHWRIMLVHIFPNVLNTFLVLISLNVGSVVLLEATLSFLGAGIPPPNPSWGSMISEGRAYMNTAWWIAVIPGIAIGLVVLAFNMLGDWLRDTLDPKLRQL